MTPEERELVVELFDRLAALERERRDPEAEQLIREGLARAPNAVYALVQTVLLQDEALRTANDRITALEEALRRAEEAQEPRSFLGGRSASKWNTGSVVRGSVPPVRPSDRPMGVPPAFERGRDEPGEAYRDAPAGGYGSPWGGGATGEPGRGAGSFLGTAAAVAAGAIGGSLLLSGIRSALAGQGDKGPFSGAFDHLGAGKSGGAGDLAREAGLDDIGKQGALSVADRDKDTGYDTDADDSDDSDLDEDDLEEDFSDEAFDDNDV
ncbi:MAG: DUF2076 domain-containing protein [Variibacter sp.]|nr:DUF2076 domain-containing protein [Variibacter sp.]